MRIETHKPDKARALKRVSHDLAFMISVQRLSVELLSQGGPKPQNVGKLSNDLLSRMIELKKFVDEEAAGGGK